MLSKNHYSPHHLHYLLLLVFQLHANLAASGDLGFTFNGFSSASAQLQLDGTAFITQEGLLRLTTAQTHVKGHAFYKIPIPFRNSTTNSALSFSATYVFAIVSNYPNLGGNGIAFAIAPSTNFSTATGSQYFGVLNSSLNGKATNHLLFVELDSIYNPEIFDINDNHVGVDVNSVNSINFSPAGYYPSQNSNFENLTLISGDPIQVWVEYDSNSRHLHVTLAPINASKSTTPLLSSPVNLTDIIDEHVYVGFSASTGSYLSSHYILGWSFQVNGKAKPLNISALPKLPKISSDSHVGRTIWISIVSISLFVLVISVIVFTIARRIKFSELVEDWEAEYKSQRFSYRDLYKATGGFHEKHLLGAGGFGQVYKGVLRATETSIAVKRVSHNSKQGTKEFIAELASLGHLRHRNLVPLLGYCRRKHELMLVYEYMPNGSLDKLLFSPTDTPLTWKQRLHIIRGVACGLYYLHEEWEKVVIHRDVKASNIMLDGDYNGRLGDFGLARLYDHGSDPLTTHVVGTIGYLAPELIRTGRATKATDVFSFGVFVLEVVCGRSPTVTGDGNEEVLMDWVVGKWRRGEVREVVDGRMEVGSEEGEELERVLGIGVRCCHPVGSRRPDIKQVVGALGGGGEVREEEWDVGRKVLAAELQKEIVEDRLTSEASPFVTSSVLWTGR